MSEQFKTMMMEPTNNRKIIKLRKEINELLMSNVGLTSDKEKVEKSNLIISKANALKMICEQEK